MMNACLPAGKNKAAVLSAIEEHKILPAEVFTAGRHLYIKYCINGKDEYFRAPLYDKKSKAINRYDSAVLKYLNTKSFFINKDLTKKVIFPQIDYTPMLKDFFLKLAPQKNLSGVLIIVMDNELLLYKDKTGAVSLTDIEKAPQNIRIERRISAVEFKDLLLDEMRLKLKDFSIEDTKFLFPIKNAPLEPYIYVDLESNSSLNIQLPEYYEVKRQISQLGLSLSLLFSVFIKSHLYAVVKAPFTSVHRLLSLAYYTAYNFFNPALPDLKNIPQETASDVFMDNDDFNKYLNKKISRRVYKGSLQMLIDGDEFFPHFILNTRNTQNTIFIRMYIFGADAYALKVGDMLKEKSKEGADVRIILDELNTIYNNTKTPRTAFSKDFVMPADIKRYLKKDSKLSLRTHLNTWGTFDHNKVIILDRTLAYTGGMNFADEYRYVWHDMMLALKGPIVGRMVKDFYKNWSFNGPGGDFAAAYRVMFSKKERSVNKATPDMVDIRLLYTAPGNPEIYTAQMEAIKRAKKRIYIQNAYFANDRIVKELIKARGRGVDVRVILPSENDVTIMHKSNIAIANKLHKNGIKVYFYKGMTHVKAALYDNWALVGSANFDKMSLFVNKETGLAITDEKFVKELDERLFRKDFKNSDLMTSEKKLDFSYYLMNTLAKQL